MQNINRTFVLSSILMAMVIMLTFMTGCGENKQIVGEWHMTKVLVGEQEFESADFLDPTGKTDGTFVIKFYGDQTLIATGSLGTIKGASDGAWEKIENNIYQISIDNQNREVKLVEDLLFMEIEIKEATIVLVFERQ
jgi:hypothetical protein